MPSYVRPGIRKCAKNRALSVMLRTIKKERHKYQYDRCFGCYGFHVPSVICNQYIDINKYNHILSSNIKVNIRKNSCEYTLDEE